MNDKDTNDFSGAYGRLLDNKFSEEKRMREDDIACIKSYRRKIKKLLSSINTYYPYRELSLAKTKLEEAEMWLSKLTKGGEE